MHTTNTTTKRPRNSQPRKDPRPTSHITTQDIRTILSLKSKRKSNQTYHSLLHHKRHSLLH